METKAIIIDVLESLWPKNKAKGLLAQAVLMQEVNKGVFGEDAGEKIFSGCWLLAPKSTDFYKFRFCFFVHPSVLKLNDSDIAPKSILGDKYRPFHAIAEFMDNAGIGTVYAVPTTDDGKLPFQDLKIRNFSGLTWHLFSFSNGEFISREAQDFFTRWDGNRGRASSGTEWDLQTKNKITDLSEPILTELLLNELFYSGFVKTILRKPLNDPYDVDSFLISISQKHIFPMEIKEKFPAQNSRDKFFGIDAGRIMMLLRVCLPNDANSVYLIRELDESGKFIGWKYMTLSDIVMTSSWNLQAGGPGMGGQSTQTIRLPYDHFKDFTASEITEDNLKNIGNLPKDVKTIARQFGTELLSKFYR
ncbi:MAG: hypothetical protein EPN22_17155 [Nitrospirae bacterium]|nr:MAG: hypothetical protein EPN22_17155 [Nitrospirota bacterium]